MKSDEIEKSIINKCIRMTPDIHQLRHILKYPNSSERIIIRAIAEEIAENTRPGKIESIRMTPNSKYYPTLPGPKVTPDKKDKKK